MKSSAAHGAADVVVRGPIHTMADGDDVPHTAAAVRGGEFVAMDAEAESLIGPETHVVSTPPGACVMPGLGDIHTHLELAGGSLFDRVQLDPAAGVDEMIERISEAAQRTPEGEWIVGGLWGVGLLEELDSLDARARIDAATAGHPLLLRDETAHHRLVNSATLRLMGLDGDASSWAPDVSIDALSGRATGVLVESGSRRAEECLERERPRADTELRAVMRAATKVLSSVGVTMTQEAATGERALAALAALDRADDLGCWITTSASVNDLIFGFTPVGERLLDRVAEYATPRVRPTYAKIFLDGTPPTFTASFHDTYPASFAPEHGRGPDFRGTTTMPLARLVEWLCQLHARGLGAKVHCTGDASVTMVLDAVDAARERGVVLPVQLAHAQFIARTDYARLAEADIPVDICPQLWYPSPFQRAAVAMVPVSVRATMCAFREQLDAGVRLVGGSDWPVSPSPNPWPAIHGLVTRAHPDGTFPGVFLLEQAVSVREAVAIFTRECARAMGIAAHTGTIEVGKSADFVVIDRDPFAIAATRLGGTHTLQTWMGGRPRFAA